MLVGQAGGSPDTLVRLKVTNWAWWDRTYRVKVVAVDAAGQEAVTGHGTFDLPRSGGQACQVAAVTWVKD